MEREADVILEFMRFAMNLKNQTRSIVLPSGRKESPAEHSWGLTLFITMVARYLSKPFDLLQALKMAIIHDLVEAEDGDIPHGHTLKYENIRELKQQREIAAITKIRDLIGGELGQKIYDLWVDFEEMNTYEAKIVRALDSLEANFESFQNGVGYWDPGYFLIALNKAKELCKDEEILKVLDEMITVMMEKAIVGAGHDIEYVKSGGYEYNPLKNEQAS